ncbi:Uncharacterised protein [Vibrio cholerae]|nr:Uncharacterised protein [Vibrio cholerae]
MDLANTLTSEIDLTTHFFQGRWFIAKKPKATRKHFFLLWIKFIQPVEQRFTNVIILS